LRGLFVRHSGRERAKGTIRAHNALCGPSSSLRSHPLPTYIHTYVGAIKEKHVPQRERGGGGGGGGGGAGGGGGGGGEEREIPFSLFTTLLLITARGLSRCFCRARITVTSSNEHSSVLSGI